MIDARDKQKEMDLLMQNWAERIKKHQARQEAKWKLQCKIPGYVAEYEALANKNNFLFDDEELDGYYVE